MKSHKDIFTQLKSEHNELKELLNEAESCQPSRRSKVLEKLEKELVPHARGEEKSLYALVLERAKDRDRSETSKLINEAYEEHGLVDQMMADLKKRDTDSPQWYALLEVLKENIEHHIKEEEKDLFEKARSLLSTEELDQIHISYQKMKSEFEKNMPTQGQISERNVPTDLKKAVGS